jgi:uncharacterized membrane protein
MPSSRTSSNRNPVSFSRAVLATGIAAFGVQHLIYAIRGAGLGPPWTPDIPLLAALEGIIFILAAAAFLTGRRVQLTAIILGAIFVLRAVLCYAPKLAANPYDPGPWTSAFELLAMSGAILTLVTQSGRFLLAASLIVFGVQHFLYAHFIAGLIPVWIPSPLVWAYFVGAAFLAAAAALISGKLAPLAARSLGVMFLLWVLLLHAPRTARDVRNVNEWTSFFVALTMSGGSFITASALQSRLTNPLLQSRQALQSLRA